jgi:molybdate transport system substrate-binding protein
MPPHAVPLQLISSMATREVLAELAARYARDTAQPVSTEAAGGVDVAKRVAAGEPVDVVVLAGGAIDKLIAEQKLLAGSRVDLLRSGVAIAVRAGATRPELGDEAAVRRAVLAARSVSYSTGPSGVYLESLFKRWGIHELVAARVVVPPPGVPVAALLAEGRAELGFQQTSELMNAPGIDVLGPLPPAIQHVTIFAGAIAAASTRTAAARALLGFLGSPAVAAVKQRFGLEPCEPSQETHGVQR